MWQDAERLFAIPLENCHSAQRLACRNSLLHKELLEAAGIEPASRDIAVPASTCLVGLLGVSLVQPPTDGVPEALVGNGSLILDVPDVTQDEPELSAGVRASPAKALSRGYLSLGSQREIALGSLGLWSAFYVAG